MSTWSQLGEGSGFSGGGLSTYRISCSFCLEKANFEIAFHAEKKKPNSKKKLNFDTLKCGNCSGYVMVFWSKNEHDSIHNFKVLPWRLKYDSLPDHWPEQIGRYWLQAKRTIRDENWDAAAVMARSALQLALRGQNASGRN